MADEWETAGDPVPLSGSEWEPAGESTSLPPREDVSAGMALRGVPILGAYVPQAEAAIRATAQPLTGVGEPGATWSERYAANLPKRQAEYTQAEQESPVLSEALKIGGGMAALAPIGATALGARALGTAGPMAARIPLGAVSGAGIAAADAAARGEDPVTAATIGGGLGAALPIVGGAVGKIGQVARSYRGSPVADELGDVVDAGYDTLRQFGAQYNPTAISNGIAKIKKAQSIHQDLSPKTWALLNETQSATAPSQPGAMAALTGVQPTAKVAQTFDDIDTLRKRLGALGRNYKDPDEAAAARAAMRGIDDLLSNPANIISGDAKQIAAIAKETRANAAAEFRLRAMDALRQRAEDQAASAASGMNVENAYRQQLRAFIRPDNKGISPAKREGFTEQEINKLRKGVSATSFPNLLRLVGNMLGGGHGIMAGAGIGIGIGTGDPRWYAAVGAGLGARKLSNAMMRSRAAALGRMTGARSPLAQQMGVAGPAPPMPGLAPAQAAFLSPIINAAGFKKGGRVTKSFYLRGGRVT